MLDGINIIILIITIIITTQVLTTDELGERVAAVYRVVNQSEWTKVEIPLRYDVNLITISAGATDKTLNEQGYVAIDDLYIHRGECKQKGQQGNFFFICNICKYLQCCHVFVFEIMKILLNVNSDEDDVIDNKLIN